MKETWASGSAELLHHAKAHMDFDSAIDRRLAFISIDNAAELILSTYISLPARVLGARAPTRGEVDRASGSFPRLLDLAYKLNPIAFDELSLNDVEYYHRLRNMLYHEGTGISVDESHLAEYYRVTCLLQLRLLGVDQDTTLAPASLADTQSRLLAEARQALADAFNTRQSKIVTAANQRIRAEGGRIGREPKILHKRQERAIERLWEKGASREEITREVNRIGKALDSPITISPSGVKRRISLWIAEGRVSLRPNEYDRKK